MPELLAIVCEAEADFLTADRLIKRTLCTAVDWLEDVLIHCKIWLQPEPGLSFLRWDQIPKLAKDFRIKLHGHFDDQPAEPDARAARKALRILRKMTEDREPEGQIKGIVLLRDIDAEPSRRDGLEQARTEAESTDSTRKIVIGVANPKREAWILAGFIPENNLEEQRLDDLSKELALDPTKVPYRLRGPRGDSRNVKRVLEVLTNNDHAREMRCLETDLGEMVRRGCEAGLKDFHDDIRARLVPIFTRAS